jgi:hypothetical protein
MTKLKFFTVYSGKDSAMDLQEQVDNWINENPSASIVSSNIAGNEHRFILTITYTE